MNIAMIMTNKRMTRNEYERISKQKRYKVFIQKILHIIARFMIHPKIRVIIYKKMGVNIGKNVFIGLDTYLDDQYPELINIEDDVTISVRGMVIVHDDAKKLDMTTSERKEGEGTVAPVNIKKGAYIGAGAILLPGCTIGENAIIGAGAVVTKDISSNSIAVGAPAKVIKSTKNEKLGRVIE